MFRERTVTNELKREGRALRREFKRQLRGFPLREVKRQVTSGWGDEFFKQIFGHSRRRRYGGNR
jgi:hypothetical protein